MKKIYIFTAVLALLAMSLNAQVANKGKDKISDKGTITTTFKPKAKVPTMNELLAGIKGMSNILPSSTLNEASSAKGQMRAPLKINSDEYLVGPYTTDEFGNENSYGFPDAYGDNDQWITPASVLTSDEFMNHVGDEIVGFRFALGGNSSNTIEVSRFIAYPLTSSGSFDTDNIHSWNIAELASGGNPQIGDINITASTTYIYITRIAVVSGSTTIEEWTTSMGSSLPNGWECSGTWNYNTSWSEGMLNGTITIPASHMSGYTTVQVIVQCYAYNTSYTVTVNDEAKNVSYNSTDMTWTVSAGSGSSDYAVLNGNQWHEYYLEEPIEFNVGSDVNRLLIGYTYHQYPTSSSNFKYPFATNPNSTGHSHYAFMYADDGQGTTSYSDIVIQPSSNSVNFYEISVISGGTTITSWTTSNGSSLPSGWSSSGQWNYSSNYGGYTSGTITIPASLFSSYSDVQLQIRAYGDNANQSITVAGEQKPITTSAAYYTWDINSTTNPNYVQKWWGYNFSEIGDLAVQLIFKSNLPKTDAPTITVGEATATGVTVTATATDPTASVTLTVGDQTITGTGSVSITIDRGTTDQNLTATATAQEDGKRVSDPATASVTVPMLPITPTPTITYEVTNATVVITATGEGTVYLEVDGQTRSGEGTVSITIMRSIEDQTVTANATAVLTDHQPSATASEDINVPALAGNPAVAKEGLLRMHLLVVDQLKADIPNDNSHPDRYGYVLKWEQPANVEDHKESGTVQVDIQKTAAQVNGYYTLNEIDNDTHIGINHDEGITMNVLPADVTMELPGENPDVLYYQMQGKANEYPALDEDYLTQLQYMKNVQKYEEMLETSPSKGQQYNANETYHYFDDSTPIMTGEYGVSFMTYAPSVSTWGIQRRYFEYDGYDNTYGAPIWKTGVGDVELKSATAEKQQGWNTTWKDTDGNTECRLYMLDKIEAWGYLPTVSNVEYEPYMFRIFVESENGKLRKFKYETDENGNKVIAADETTPDEQKEPLCVWSAYVNTYDDEVLEAWNTAAGNQFNDGNEATDYSILFNKNKVNRDQPENETDPTPAWDKDEENAIFGVVDDIVKPNSQGQDVIDPDDLTIFVRFYYIVKGMSQGWTPWNTRRNAGGDDPAGYGAESPGFTPGPATAVNEMHYVGEVVGQTYYNVQGMTSDKPFDGVNIVVTRYSNGTTSVSKVVK